MTWLRKAPAAVLVVGLGIGVCLVALAGGGDEKKAAPNKVLPDAIAEAQMPRPQFSTRPEQKLSEHDKSQEFKEDNAPASSPAIVEQHEKGRMNGFEFYRDPPGASKPKT